MDFDLERNSHFYKSLLERGVYYLENESVEIEGIKIWGSPAVPNFVGVFNYARGSEIRGIWDMIPLHTQILITHGPPAGILDKTSRGFEAGCTDLKEIVENIQPMYHVFGHIHEAYGTLKSGLTTYVNVSFVSRRPKPNAPFEFEIIDFHSSKIETI